MRFQILFLILLAVFTVTGASNAQAATDTSAVISRMDSIIKQMEALKAEFAALASSVGTTPTGAVLGAQSTPVFTLSLEPGETNSDIKKIQKLLATDSEIYPYGVASGFFGPKTEEGIKNLQARFGLKQVGVVGPATRSLLELFMNAYPNENYPADVLKKKPTVLGASVTVPPVVSTPVTSVSGSELVAITAKYNGSSAKVTVKYADKTGTSFELSGNTKISIVDGVASKLGKTRAQILTFIEFSNGSSSDDDEDEDDDDDSDSDDIDSIVAKVKDGKASVRVRYENGDDDKFTVKEDSESDIIEEVADELNMDEEDVEDIIEFKYEPVEKIRVAISGGKAKVTVTFEDGTEKKFTVKSDDDDDIIEEIAEILDEDEDDVEDWVEFD